jgi:hypothetical protein
MAPRSRARRSVDQLEAPGFQPPERAVQVMDPVRDVMEPRTAGGQEPAHRRVRTQGLEELEPGRTRTHEADHDALRVHSLRARARRAGQRFVPRKHRVDGLDRDGDMVEGETLQTRSILHEYLGRQLASISARKY